MLTGGCQCGALRYEVRAEPVALYVCHCLECRAQSASAFGITVSVPAAAAVLTQGESRVWRRQTNSGKTLACHFCGDCGTRIWHRDEPEEAEISIKGGSLDVAPDLTRAIHIWTRSALPGVVIPPGATTFPQEPV